MTRRLQEPPYAIEMGKDTFRVEVCSELRVHLLQTTSIRNCMNVKGLFFVGLSSLSALHVSHVAVNELEGYRDLLRWLYRLDAHCSDGVVCKSVSF